MRAATVLGWTGGILGALGGAAHLAALANVRRIERTPDPYTLDELLEEPEGEEVFVERPDGTRLRAITAGSGPTIVFSHGYAATVFEWNVLWKRLRGSYRLIAFDHRGHGRSTIGRDGISSRAMAADLAGVLDFFDVSDALLVGHSMGGFLSIVALLDHADVTRARLRHALIVASFAGDVTRGAPQTKLQIPLIETGIIPALNRTKTYGWFFTSSQFGKRRFASGVEAFRREFNRRDHAKLVPILRALQDENYYPRLGEIRVPCTIVCGDADDTTPKHHSEWLARDIPNARAVIVPESGHMINWEAPDALEAAIRSV